MTCKNCGTSLNENQHYCYECGAKVIRNRLTFKNLFEHISETFFNYDNKLLRTAIDLIKKPEAVIDGYVNGIRKRYVNPISFFGLSITITGISVLIIKKYYSQYLDFSSFYENMNVPDSAFSTNTIDFLEYNSLFYFIIIPLFALFSKITFWSKGYNFVEHLIIYLYTMSLLSIVLVFLGQLLLIINPELYLVYSFGSYVLMFLYHCFVLKRIFNIKFGELVLKSMLFLALFFMFYVGSVILFTLFMFLTGNWNVSDFAPKN